MKYFFDTEFHEYKPNLTGIDTIELISIGIVAEDGRELYLISNQFNVISAFDNEWLKNNVLKPIYDSFPNDNNKFDWIGFNEVVKPHSISRDEIKEQILKFVGDDEKPEFYAYYGAYDWVVFC
ncbi:MAG TPA: hypothetical protein VNI84_12200, partial [Pyrinomonadaceae bacterium]|nr:hypothetical protein [Pyrinomonadaceae bacterium]